MPLTVLHTSDWHLGASLETASREEEQRRFLDWLLRTLRERKVDLLLIAGDVFHHSQPSAEALNLYYRFLARLPETGVARTVVVGGNHDSPSRLDAPRQLLEALSIDVVGGLSSAAEAVERCVVPVEVDGELAAVVAAVPFVHEFRLGVRTTGATPSEIRARFSEVFGGLYRNLADRAREVSGQVPLLATGHLTAEAPAGLADALAGRDFETEIHQVGAIGGLPPSIFDPRYAYVALGHIHRSYPVLRGGRSTAGAPSSRHESRASIEAERATGAGGTKGRDDAPLLPGFEPASSASPASPTPGEGASDRLAGDGGGGDDGDDGDDGGAVATPQDLSQDGGSGPTVWYAGSPVALSYPESRHPRSVLLVEIDRNRPDAPPRVEKIPVPVERPLVRFEGPPDEVIDRLRALGESREWDPATDLRAYCSVDLRVASYTASAVEEVQRAVADLPEARRPRLVKITQSLTGEAAAALEPVERLLEGDLSELDPETVFVRLHEVENAGEPPRDELLRAFRSLLVDGEHSSAGEGSGGGAS